MRVLLLALVTIGLGACTQEPNVVQQGFSPEPAPIAGSSADSVGPPADLPTGAAHKVCVTAVNLC
jgi:hypothetical protein